MGRLTLAWRGQVRREQRLLGALPVARGASYCVHLGADLIEEARRVVFGNTFGDVEIEVGSIGDVSEMGVGVEALQDCVEFVRGSIEIERVGRADNDVNLSAEERATLGPGRGNNMRKVEVVAPIRDDGGVDIAGVAIEHLLGL